MASGTPVKIIAVATDGTTTPSGELSPNRGVHQGLCVEAKIIIPNYTNDVLTDVFIVDEDGDEIFAFADMERATTHLFTDLSIPLVEKEYFTALLDSSPGGSNPYTITVVPYYTPDHRK